MLRKNSNSDDSGQPVRFQIPAVRDWIHAGFTKRWRHLRLTGFQDVMREQMKNRKRHLKLNKNQYRNIEKEFYYYDEKEKVAQLCWEFEGPDEIFDKNSFTNIPVLNDDFVELLISVFDYVPPKYKLDITVCFNDMEGFDEKELDEICRKNILLLMKVQNRKANDQNTLALLLCGIGLLFGLLYFYVLVNFPDGGTLQEIGLFFLEIIATVPFWGAADIFFVDNSEQRKAVKKLKKRFHQITFTEKSADEAGMSVLTGCRPDQDKCLSVQEYSYNVEGGKIK